MPKNISKYTTKRYDKKLPFSENIKRPCLNEVDLVIWLIERRKSTSQIFALSWIRNLIILPTSLYIWIFLVPFLTWIQISGNKCKRRLAIWHIETDEFVWLGFGDRSANPELLSLKWVIFVAQASFGSSGLQRKFLLHIRDRI